MKKALFISGIILLGIANQGTSGDMTNDKKDNILKVFPNLTIANVEEVPIKGPLYEVVSGDQIFYWNEGGYVIFGEIYTKDGKSITAEKKEKLLAEKVKQLPLDKSLKIGSGANTIIEFSDPDCPFCRKLNDFLSKRLDVTRYIFMFPLQMHKDAVSKSAYILSSKDPVSAHSEVFSGKFDKNSLPVQSDHAKKMVEDQLNTGRAIGIRGTPVLWVNGSYVNGADLERISALLEGRKEVKKP